MSRRPARLRLGLLAAALAAAGLLGCATDGGPGAGRAPEAAAGFDAPPLLGPLEGAAPSEGPVGRALAAQARAARTVPGAEVEAGASVVVVRLPADLLFERGRDALGPAARGRLRAMASILAAQPHTRVLVAGHTDAEGAEAENLGRSRARAEAVRAALVEEGILAERLVAVGLGEALPLAGEGPAPRGARARRVELEIRPDAALRAEARAGRRRPAAAEGR